MYTTENRQKMEASEASHIVRRLQQDGLYQLPKFLRQYKEGNIVISGSYTLELDPADDWKPNDIDLWIPFSDRQQYYLFRLLRLMIESGYSSITTRNRYQGQIAPNAAYRRMDYMIETIYSLRDPVAPRTRVQILLLQKSGGTSGPDLINHFDLNLSRQYYDGTSLYRPITVSGAILNKYITLNVGSHVICM